MKLIIDIPEELYQMCKSCLGDADCIESAIANGTPITSQVLADALMEERIRGELNSDTIFEKDVIRDVKCRLEVNIRDRRSYYCGAGLREVWRESENKG
jgi:hypothetical protein